MKRLLYILPLLLLFCGFGKAKNKSGEFWKDICRNDLSQTVLIPDTVPCEIYSWWTDEHFVQWIKENGTGYEFHEDRWINRPIIVGYRGPNYQRFDMRIFDAKKITQTKYQVMGEAQCMQQKFSVRGVVILDSIGKIPQSYDYDFIEDFTPGYFKFPLAIGCLYAHYEMAANDGARDIAKLEGKSCYLVLDYEGKVYYDAFDFPSDGYRNNQYEGFWIDLVEGDTMVCNWGDGRIPNSHDMDIGAGEFSVDPKYRKYGWEDFSF